jgi:phage-related protein
VSEQAHAGPTFAAEQQREARVIKPSRYPDCAELVQRMFGIVLFATQKGEMPPIAKPLKGFGHAGVLELIEDDRAGTYRAAYTVRFGTATDVLHVFQNKSKQGIGTPAHEMDLIMERLKRAEDIHAERMKEQTR